MKIRTRLAARFVLIVAAILISFSTSIYYLSSINREQDFNRRLKNRAVSTAKLLLEVAEVRNDLLKIIDRYTVNALYDERIAIFNDSDSLLYHSEETGHALHISPALLDSVRAAGILYVSRDKDIQMVAITHKGKYRRYVIMAAARDEIGLTHKKTLKRLLVTGTLVSLCITGFFGWLFSMQMLHPLSKIIKSVDSITASNLAKRLNEGKRQDELEYLAMTFNKMLDRLEDAFEMQRRFVSNASHELRTPLTAVIGQIDVTLLKKRDQEEYEKVLRSVLDEMKKLTQLTNGLLKLAQIYSENSELGSRKVRIDELLWSLKEDFSRLQPGYTMQIDFEDYPEDEDQVTLHGNESLLKTAFLNLVDNACKYSPDNKMIVKASFDHGIVLRFLDKGRGIPKKDLRNIIQPFYRGVNSSGVSGHGLGLSLANKVILLHHGTLTINSEEGVGTEVVVAFKS